MRAGANPERDVTPSRIHEDLASLLDTIDDWVVVSNLQGRVLYLNAIAERQLGRVAGRTHFEELWSDEGRPDLDGLLRAARERARLAVVTRAAPKRRIELRLCAGRYQEQPALIAVGREQPAPEPTAPGDGRLEFHARLDSDIARERLQAIATRGARARTSRGRPNSSSTAS